MNLQRLSDIQPSAIDFIRWYQNPDRHYHNLNHISECLSYFQEVLELLSDPQSVWMALWFHDCVYSTRPNANNEELSAAEARRFLKEEDRKQIVTRLILVTKHSPTKYPPLTSDECFMCDIDLVALGALPEKFDLNSTNIRQEYINYDDFIYVPARIDILQGFLDRAKSGNFTTQHTSTNDSTSKPFPI